MQQRHRKTVRHYDEPGHVHELTFSCYRRLPLLTNDDWRQQLCTAIDRAAVRHGYRLFAFVLMPEHVHLIVHPHPDGSAISDLLRAIKRPFSYRIKQGLVETGSRLLDRLTVRQRPGVMTFRFWQEGPGYDRNLTEPSTILAAVEYVHENPVRRGLVQQAIDWKWSSARWYVDPSSPPEPMLPTLHRPGYDLLQ